MAGFYDFGDEYYILTDFDNPHFDYVAVHERVHANLGSGTSYGLFQSILFRLMPVYEHVRVSIE